MERQKRSVHLVVTVVAALAAACSVGPDGTYQDLQPLVFPSEGRLGTGGLGSTAAIALDSNYVEGLDIVETYDLRRSRVTVTVVDPLGVFADAAASVRSVVALQAAPTSTLHASRPGAWVTLVFFDLPDAADLGGSLSYPFTAELEVAIDTAVTFAPRFIVTGEGGMPNELLDVSFATAEDVNGSLESRPALRLRPKRIAGGFAEGQPTLGGLQVDVRYLTACMSGFSAFAGSEAADANSYVGPVIETANGYKRRRVVMSHPAGFDLNFLADEPGFDTTDETLAGEGPLLDLAVNWKPTNNDACDLLNPSLLLLENLQVADRDGNSVFAVAGSVEMDTVDLPTSTAYFRSYAIDLPPPPAQGGGGCGIGWEIAPVLVALGAVRRRRGVRS